MLPDDAKVISVDDHVIEHPRVWLDNWPHTRTMLAEALADVPDDEARLVVEGNARRIFTFPA